MPAMCSPTDRNRTAFATHRSIFMKRLNAASISMGRRACCTATVGTTGAAIVATVLTLTACNADRADSRTQSRAESGSTTSRVDGVSLRVRDTVVAGIFDASGIADPMQQATLSTKLMGTVQEVLVHEGDAVHAGQPLLRIDARELAAKSSQVASSIADAEALEQDAATHANRIRALYADSAATRAQLDAAETGLIRASASVRAARASANELEAMSSYATLRAPFNGIVTRRLADAGSFASPGTPLLTVQDISTLRINASVSADGARLLHRGQEMSATIDGAPVSAIVEGIVPANAGNLFTLNATVRNPRGEYRAGSAATLRIPAPPHHALLVPLRAIVRDGDLTGVIVRGAERDERRWIRLGAETDTYVEVTSGLRVGEEIVIPTVTPSATSPIKAGV